MLGRVPCASLTARAAAGQPEMHTFNVMRPAVAGVLGNDRALPVCGVLPAISTLLTVIWALPCSHLIVRAHRRCC